jgi:hypothetical protein
VPLNISRTVERERRAKNSIKQKAEGSKEKAEGGKQ